MSHDFLQMLDPMVFNRSESLLTFGLSDLSDGKLISWGGELKGPHCRFSHTLPSSFEFPQTESIPETSNCGIARVTDPCYWTPHLPFLYSFKGQLNVEDGLKQHFEHSVGFRGWEIRGTNFLLNQRRTVLRGAYIADPAGVDLEAARESEMTLFVDEPEEDFLQQASELGVPIVANLQYHEILTPQLLSLAWQPAVFLVLASPTACYIPHDLQVGWKQDDRPDAGESLVVEHGAFHLVDLQPGERPADKLKHSEKPVIALRRKVEFADLAAARRACDRLQAELAPEFDLAGYFVSP